MAAFHWGFGNCFADPGDEPDDYPTRHAVDVDAEGSAREWSEDAGASHNYEYIFCCWWNNKNLAGFCQNNY